MAITINGSGTLSGLAVGGLPDASVTADDLASGLASQGIEMVDQWNVTSNSSINGESTITSNWSRYSTVASVGSYIGTIGTGMSESSGIFTFPQTGLYQVFYNFMFRCNGGRTYIGQRQAISTDSGSNFTNSTTNYTNGYMNTAYATVSSLMTYDVTDVSTFRIKFIVNVSDTGNLQGSSGVIYTGAVFTRVGDT